MYSVFSSNLNEETLGKSSFHTCQVFRSSRGIFLMAQESLLKHVHASIDLCGEYFKRLLWIVALFATRIQQPGTCIVIVLYQLQVKYYMFKVLIFAFFILRNIPNGPGPPLFRGFYLTTTHRSR
jgi:hypothetical protein